MTQTAFAQRLPKVPDGFEIKLVAKEPLVRNPCSLAFDAKGRIFIGMGPQYRKPTPKTAGDSVVILQDRNRDGVYDSRTTFATGFNAIQGLAWHGKDLWIANAPDLTVVRDIDGDDVADKYTLVYTDLGNLEHGLHGLTWGPDGRLYMSKGNSKGLTRPGRIAPKPFRDLWGVKAPAGSPDFPAPKTFGPKDYRHAFHHPADDWGREGGVLVCDDMGKNLEIVSRGFRNPWDIGFDSEFNFQGTDNDQNEGDRVFMSYFGAHYGWGHPWSAHWTGKNHLPTAPITGPVFHGSGTGIVFYEDGQFPAQFNGVWFFNDWLRRTTYVYRPVWKGALIQPAKGEWVEFVRGAKLLYKPTDIDIGPDGSMYILGWGNSYGATYDKKGGQTNEGRIWRVRWKAAKKRLRIRPRTPISKWTVAQLVSDFRGPLPIWRSNAQDELVRRGNKVLPALTLILGEAKLTRAEETWLCWTFGRMTQSRQSIDRLLAQWLAAGTTNKRVQALRIMAYRARRGGSPLAEGVAAALRDKNARIRFAAVQAIRRGKGKAMVPALVQLAAVEKDRVVFYAAWQAFRVLLSVQDRRSMLQHKEDGVQQAAILSLAEDYALTRADAARLLTSKSSQTLELLGLWTAKRNGNPLVVVTPRGGQFAGRLTVNVVPGLKPARVHFTTDGSTPSVRSPRWTGSLTISKTTTLKVAIFINDQRVGRVAEMKYVKGKVDSSAVHSGIYDVIASSKRPYRLVAALRPGRRVYADRSYVFRAVPTQLNGSYFVQTSNDDSGSQGNRFLKMETVVSGTLYFGHDTRVPKPPTWLKTNGKNAFSKTQLVVKTNDATFRVYRREFSPGTITLGGNSHNGQSGGKSNYLVIIRPKPFLQRKQATTLNSVLPLLRRANRESGQALFLSDAVGCAKCHRTDGKKSFGPDLAHLVKSPDARQLVTSLLKPSAQIKEGFTTQLVATKQGKVFRGVLSQETGKAITLLQSDLKTVTIRKSSIKSRKSQQISPMPAYDHMLSPQQVADLSAWLLSRKAK